MYERIKNYLHTESRARERTLHQRGMVNLLLAGYPELKEIPKDKLVDFCHDFESYCRIWRKVLEENKELRGTDYDTKEVVEQEYMLKIGYEPRYNEDSKQLKMI